MTSMRVSSTPLIANSLIVGDTGLGVEGINIPSTGQDGPSVLFQYVTLPADNDAEFRWLITSQSGLNSLETFEDGSFIADLDTTGTIGYEWFKDGVSQGSDTVDLTIGSGTTRVFINNDKSAPAYYSLASPIVMSGDFEINLEFTAGVMGYLIADNTPSTGVARIAIQSDGSLWVNDDANAAIFNNTLIAEIVAIVGDGKLHTLGYYRTGTTVTLYLDGALIGTRSSSGAYTFNTIGARKGASTGIPNWNGILANPIFNNAGTITSWNLDEATASTETNAEGGNVLTYENQELDQRELFELSDDQTQWDNISPPVQQLPSVIEIATISSSITITVTEQGPSFTESINTTLTAAINAAITESGPSFTESITATLTSLTLSATITEQGPSFTESITANLLQAITAAITESGPSFSESILARTPTPWTDKPDEFTDWDVKVKTSTTWTDIT